MEDTKVVAKNVAVVAFVSMVDKEAHAKNVMVVAFVSMEGGKVHARNVAVVAFVSILNKDFNAKNVALVIANTDDSEARAKNVVVVAYAFTREYEAYVEYASEVVFANIRLESTDVKSATLKDT